MTTCMIFLCSLKSHFYFLYALHKVLIKEMADLLSINKSIIILELRLSNFDVNKWKVFVGNCA